MLNPGDKLDRYEVISLLGQGGMGQVYKAFDPKLHREIALKVLLPAEEGAGSEGSQAASRMLREARAAAALNHPNAISVYDVGEWQGGMYIAMELIHGMSLRSYVGDKSIGIERKLRWLIDAARALGAAHKAGIVHRDMKPENVMVRDDDVIKVLDFGIARRCRVDSMPEVPGAEALSTRTSAGAVVGTPRYMAPEQVKGAELDGRTDQFAWGITAYETLAGVMPWGAAGDALAILASMLTEEPRALRQLAPDVAEQVDRAILRALCKRPEDRFACMQDVIDAMEARPSANDARDDCAAQMHELAFAPTREHPVGALRSASMLREPTTGGAVQVGPMPINAPQTAPQSSTQSSRSGKMALVLILGAVGLAVVVVVVAALAMLFLMRAGAPPAPPAYSGMSESAVPEIVSPPSSEASGGRIRLSGGEFTMGSAPADLQPQLAACAKAGKKPGECPADWESPQRTVRVSPFLISRAEVTVEEFVTWLNARTAFRIDDKDGKSVMVEDVAVAQIYRKGIQGGYVPSMEIQSGRMVPLPEMGKKPITFVSWEGASRYCHARGGALPTEAQWEFAARGSAKRKFPWGDAEPSCEGVVFGRLKGRPCADRKGNQIEVAVASQDVTAEGVHDLGGNVAEWVADGFVYPYPTCAGSCQDPVVDSGTLRVFRGGMWHNDVQDLRGSVRGKLAGGSMKPDIGFRCAMPVKGKAGS